MPAWGVRTALTALRSFMAEKGTAGQVGGLEASVEVRKRLARESRGWRCEACRKSNEVIMREWWAVCRQSGVNVQEEEGVQLETLPEGMNLETRNPEDKSSTTTETSTVASGQEGQLVSESKDKGKVNADNSTGSNEGAMSNAQQPRQIPPSQSTETPSHPESKPSTSTSTSANSPSQTQNPSVGQSQSHSGNDSTSLQPPPSPTPPRMIPTPSAEAAQASAEAVLTPSDLSSSSSSRVHRPSISLVSGIHAPPLAAANAALQNPNSAAPLILQRDRARESITIDRAIAGVFLALCLMVLKKIFYPAGTDGTGFGGGVDDFYLQRE